MLTKTETTIRPLICPPRVTSPLEGPLGSDAGFTDTANVTCCPAPIDPDDGFTEIHVRFGVAVNETVEVPLF